MKKHLFLYMYFLTPITLFFVTYINNPLKYQSLFSFSSLLTGALAYSFLQWQFILSARPKWLERGIGLDYLYRFHGIMALVGISMGFVHGQIKKTVYQESLMTQLGSVALILFVAVSLFALFFMVRSKHPILRYETLKNFHNIAIVGQILITVHVLMVYQMKTDKVSFFVYTGLFVIAFTYYVWHKLLRPWLLISRPLIVTDITHEPNNGANPTVWHISMKPTSGKVNYVPGQFAFFHFQSINGMEAHPFTIASSPLDHTLVISVKNLGDFTKDLYHLKVGDPVLMDGPYGVFSFINNPNETVLNFIVAGIGITPAIAMIRHLYKTKDPRTINLYWQVHKTKDAVFIQELKDYVRHLPHLSVHIFSADANSAIAAECEPLQLHNSKITPDVFKSLHKPTTKEGFYLCGPPTFMTTHKNYLRTYENHPYTVHSESFSL